jgi:prepilin-type N-terminal cleavage/methylation domain-containing protein
VECWASSAGQPGSRITHHASRIAHQACRYRLPSPAFTLMEIMIVVGIMGIVLTMSVPIVWKIWHKPPMNKAITDIIEVCSNARARAILQGREVDLMIHPREGRFDLSATAPPPAQNQNAAGNPAPFAPQPAPQPVPQPAPFSMSGSGLSAQLDRVIIEDLDINKIPGGFRDAEQARVRFFPNGTADEMSLFLLSDTGQRCEILLEVTTGLANVEWEVRRFR